MKAKRFTNEPVCADCGEPLRVAGGVHTPEIPRPICVDCAISELERVKAKCYAALREGDG